MAFFRTLLTKTTDVTAAAAACTTVALSPSQSSQTSKSQNLSFLSSHSLSTPNTFGFVRNLTHSAPTVHMDAATLNHDSFSSQKGEDLPELLTEFMVDMTCEGCVKAVKSKLQNVEGIKNVDVDLNNQVVRILGTAHVRTLSEALQQTGKKARLIGQGVPEEFLVSAAVAEFKGPDIFGVARLAQVNMELARIEANFSGLSPGKHGWSINEYGDLTRGAASTGKIFNPTSKGLDEKPLGDLGTIDANEQGEAFFSSVKEKLRISDLIGRSIVVYGTADKSDPGLTAAVIARSAAVGENYKKICTCDGTTIWEAGDKDIVTSRM